MRMLLTLELELTDPGSTIAFSPRAPGPSSSVPEGQPKHGVPKLLPPKARGASSPKRTSMLIGNARVRTLSVTWPETLVLFGVQLGRLGTGLLVPNLRRRIDSADVMILICPLCPSTVFSPVSFFVVFVSGLGKEREEGGFAGRLGGYVPASSGTYRYESIEAYSPRNQRAKEENKKKSDGAVSQPNWIGHSAARSRSTTSSTPPEFLGQCTRSLADLRGSGTDT